MNKLPTNQIIQGDALEVLKKLPNNSIDFVMTSPPYWGLRSYPEDTVKIWDGDPNCEHEWGSERTVLQHKSGETNPGKESWYKDQGASNDTGNRFCVKCGAIKTQLGLEPTPELYVSHLMQIFNELKKVLKPTGSFYLNIGDTYSGSGGGHNFQDREAYKKYSENLNYPSERPVTNCKIPRKCLCMIPERVAMAMINNGWILRNKIIWCLSGDTNIFAKIDGRYESISIKELYRKFDECNEIFLPTMDRKNDFRWIKLKNIWDNGYSQVKEIELTNGIKFKATPVHKFPVRKGIKFRSSSYLKLHTEQLKSFKEGDHLWIKTQFDLDIPKGNRKDYERGYFVGFYLAEGNYIKERKVELKNSDFSKYALKRWAKEKGYENIEDYLENRQDVEKKGIRLSCSIKSNESIETLERLFSFNKYTYGNDLILKTRNDKALSLIKRFIAGEGAKKKKLTNEVFNESFLFMKGVLRGYLDGDGCKEKISNGIRWRIGTTKNNDLKRSILTLCRILGYEYREGSDYIENGHRCQSFTVRNYPKDRPISRGITFQAIRRISDAGTERVYDLEIEPVYRNWGNQYAKSSEPSENPIKRKWNNLYFLGNGIFTHNSKPNAMPSSVKDRLNNVWEYIYHFTINQKYYYDLDSIRIPHKTYEQEKRRSNFDEIVSYNEKAPNQVGKSRKGRSRTEDFHSKGKNPGDFLKVGHSAGRRPNYWSKQRKYQPNQKKIAEFLKKHISDTDKEKLNKEFGEHKWPHWLRTDESGKALPSPKDWKKLKEILNLPPKFDKEMLETEWVYVSDEGHPRGKNPGDIFQINTQPFPQAHFAVFPPEVN